MGHRSSWAVRVGMGMEARRGDADRGSGGEPLAGGAGRQREQAEESRAALGEGRKLGHVADACGQGDGGGPAAQQGQKPLRRLKARVVGVEGQEDAGAAPQGRGDALNALGAQGSDGGEAPSGKGEPVEEGLGDDRPRRGGAEPSESEHRLGAGKGLEPGPCVRLQRPAR